MPYNYTRKESAHSLYNNPVVQDTSDILTKGVTNMSNITTEQLVQREVIYCVSTLIGELAKLPQYQDDLLAVCVQDDWENAARDSGLTDRFGDGWQAVCERHNIEPQQTEAYEHWIITGWLADKLEAQGEMVLRDFLGMTIWGRACTGQAIAMDSAIEKIHADLTKAKGEA